MRSVNGTTPGEIIVKDYQTRAAIISHLTAKVEEEDWAAVSDAAHDLSLLDILEARSRSPALRGRQAGPTPLDG